MIFRGCENNVFFPLPCICFMLCFISMSPVLQHFGGAKMTLEGCIERESRGWDPNSEIPSGSPVRTK